MKFKQPVKMTASKRVAPKKVAPKKVWDEIRAEGEKYIEDLLDLMRRNDENERRADDEERRRTVTRGSSVNKEKGA
jgi:hypothetical protein